MNKRKRIEALEQRQAEMAPPTDKEQLVRKLNDKLEGTRQRLLCSPFPLLPVEEMSFAERMALANTREEMQTVWDEYQAEKQERSERRK
jgi:hypothetical protein